ncbi:glycoside hydrolase family 172 protein [Flavicella sp.]|uniref:glycoside hydrolase family 172 protein n=1 Tax=Flavicella sp. TaxID=2957742 RepID=UPI003016E58A
MSYSKIYNIVQYKTLKLVCFIVLIGIISCEKSSEIITVESLLKDMINLEKIAQFPDDNFRLKQQSSYNRASINPKDTIGWFMNKDFNSNEKDHNFVRIEEKNGKKEWVLMEHKGAGAIVRTWMPFQSASKSKTNSIIKFYLDGSDTPALEGNMLDLLNGNGIFPFPLAHKSLRSAVSFFPIPYAKSCKITVTKRPFFFQFTYREYPLQTNIKTFTLKDFELAKQTIQKVTSTLLNSKIEIKLPDTFSQLEPNQEKIFYLPKGEAALKNLSLKLSEYKDSTITRFVIIKMNFDGKQTVWSPIGDFFGTGVGLHPFKGWYRKVAEDGTLSCRWVMPYQKEATISIVNLSENPINFKLETLVEQWEWDENSMYFHAGFRQQYPVSTRPFSDWNYITIKGRGVYVGDALTVMNPVKRWWGEGDEKIYVDGEKFPSIFGTGTEDYYAYSWGGISTDFYEHPFHAQPRSNVYNKLNRKTTNEKNTQGYSTETRTRALDGMPFQSSLKLDMEVWSWTDCDMQYAVGMYWYGDANSIANIKPVPEQVSIFPKW